MPYAQEISRALKALFVFLLDESASMEDSFAGTGKRKVDHLAAIVNGCLMNLVMRATGSRGVQDRFDIAILAYRTDANGSPLVRSPLGGALQGRQLVSIVDIAENPARIETKSAQVSDESGGLVDVKRKMPAWLELQTGGGTPMCALLQQTCDLVSAWITSHPDSFPPIVFHFTDGESTDGDPLPDADALRALATSDGNVLLFNCYLSGSVVEPMLFPDHHGLLPDEGLRTLFEMSSVLPDAICQALRAGNVSLQPGARGMAVNADLTAELLQLLDVGTRATTSSDGLEKPFQHVPDVGAAPSPKKAPEAGSPAQAVTQPAPKLHENVQFTVYRPRTVQPQRWYPLLAFAHLDERPDDAPPHEPDPRAEVERQAKQALGALAASYQDSRQESLDAIPDEAELTFVPEMDGVEFNPRQHSLRFVESVHKAEFRLRAAADRDGQTLRGRLSVFWGAILLADVALRIKVDSAAAPVQPAEPEPLRRYRKIFASYSHRDLAVVEQFERFAETFGDRYLRDWKELRSGENWDQRLLAMIDEADVFQLFWSSNSMRSPYCRREWEHALSLNRDSFIRPTYWEDPLPQSPGDSLPPAALLDLHFTRLVRAEADEEDEGDEAAATSVLDDETLDPGGSGALAVEAGEFNSEEEEPPTSRSIRRPRYQAAEAHRPAASRRVLQWHVVLMWLLLIVIVAGLIAVPLLMERAKPWQKNEGAEKW